MLLELFGVDSFKIVISNLNIVTYFEQNKENNNARNGSILPSIKHGRSHWDYNKCVQPSTQLYITITMGTAAILDVELVVTTIISKWSDNAVRVWLLEF